MGAIITLLSTIDVFGRDIEEHPHALKQPTGLDGGIESSAYEVIANEIARTKRRNRIILYYGVIPVEIRLFDSVVILHFPTVAPTCDVVDVQVGKLLTNHGVALYL